MSENLSFQCRGKIVCHEALNRRTNVSRHVDASIAVKVDVYIAARHFYTYMIVHQTQPTRDARRCATTAARCQGVPRTAFPYFNANVTAILYLKKLDVDAIWKHRVPFDFRPQDSYISFRHSFQSDDAMRIAD